jgi:hypothetical protein
MSSKGSESASLLRAVANAVERLGEDRVKFVLRTATADELTTRDQRGPNGSIKGRSARLPRNELIRSLANRLPLLDSIAAGAAELERADLTRRELEMLARSLDVPVRKDIKVGDLEDLILNVTIGGKLNSLAIRGT